MALVFGFIFFRTIQPESKPQVCLFDICKYGSSADKSGAFAVAMNVNEGTITSSPGPNLLANKAACNAEVPN